MVLSSETGAGVPRLPSIESNKDHEMDFNHNSDNMDQDISAGKFLTAHSGTTAPFMNGIPDWMNMTPEDINQALDDYMDQDIPVGLFLFVHSGPIILEWNARLESTWKWRASTILRKDIFYLEYHCKRS